MALGVLTLDSMQSTVGFKAESKYFAKSVCPKNGLERTT